MGAEMVHERHEKIIKLINANRMVKVTELMKEFDVSIETVRRDLEFLEKKGYLKRVYGGAIPNSPKGGRTAIRSERDFPSY